MMGSRYLGIDAAGYTYHVQNIYDDGYDKVVTVSQLLGTHYAEIKHILPRHTPDAKIFEKILSTYVFV